MASALPAGNQPRILHALRRRPGLSKADLARTLHLAPATASTLVGELVGKGLVVISGLADSTGGRRPERLTLNPERPLMLGIDLGETDARLGVLDLDGRLRAVERLPFRRERGAVALEPVVAAAVELLRRHPAVEGVGVAAPGPLDSATGVIRRAVNLGWQDFPLRQLLEAHLRLPVSVDRNTNAALLAEEWWGSAPTGDPSIFITLGSGVGAAIKIGGHFLRGAGGMGGEFGHISLDPDGPPCGCGSRGCLEVFAGGRALLRRYARARRSTGRGGIGAMASAAADGDELAGRLLAEAGDHLGTGVVTLVNLVNPEVIVLGGELMEAEWLLLPRVRQAVRRRGLRDARAVRIVPSTFRDRASLIGAATIAYDALFTGRVPSER